MASQQDKELIFDFIVMPGIRCWKFQIVIRSYRNGTGQTWQFVIFAQKYYRINYFHHFVLKQTFRLCIYREIQCPELKVPLPHSHYN